MRWGTNNEEPCNDTSKYHHSCSYAHVERLCALDEPIPLQVSEEVEEYPEGNQEHDCYFEDKACRDFPSEEGIDKRNEINECYHCGNKEGEHQGPLSYPEPCLSRLRFERLTNKTEQENSGRGCDNEESHRKTYTSSVWVAISCE